MGKYTARITDLSEGGCYIDSLCEAYVGEVIHTALSRGNRWHPGCDALQKFARV